jgi:hypothetical protein
MKMKREDAEGAKVRQDLNRLVFFANLCGPSRLSA